MTVAENPSARSHAGGRRQARWRRPTRVMPPTGEGHTADRRGHTVDRRGSRPRLHAAPARLSARATADARVMDATEPPPPEPAFTLANRQRLVRHLLDLEVQRLEGDVSGDPESSAAASPCSAPRRQPSRRERKMSMIRIELSTLAVAERAGLHGIRRWLVQQEARDGSRRSVRGLVGMADGGSVRQAVKLGDAARPADPQPVRLSTPVGWLRTGLVTSSGKSAWPSSCG